MKKDNSKKGCEG